MLTKLTNLMRQGWNLRLGFLESHMICQHIEMVKSFGGLMCNKHSLRDPRLLIKCATKHCLINTVLCCDTFFSVCWCKIALQPNVQIQFSHFSMRNFEAEFSAEEQRTRGQHTLRTLTSSTSIFGRIRKIWIFKEKLNSIDLLLQWVKSFTERLQPPDNQ